MLRYICLKNCENRRQKTDHLLSTKVAHVKIGWLSRDSVSGTTDVLGSVSQYQAPIDVLIDMTVRTTNKR